MKAKNIVRYSIVKSLTFGLGMVMLVSLCGCTALWISGIVGATGAAVAGTAFVEGRLTSTLDAKPGEIKAATEKAFAKLKITTVSSTANAIDAEIKGKYPDNSSVTVSSSLEESGQSKIGIRVGTFGDQDKSLKLFAAISEELDLAKAATENKDSKKE
jgi:hypothetical protein